jgi:catechol 2,3-dioxygenase-like lactoylglutathione lyase family enzyme
MTVERMDHVGVVVEDLEAAKAFFVELGLEVQGEWQAEDAMVDRIVGLEGVKADCAMMQTPDGHGRLELVKFRAPAGPEGDGHAPSNAPGLRHPPSKSTTWTTRSTACDATARSSSARWRATEASTGFATSAARRE